MYKAIVKWYRTGARECTRYGDRDVFCAVRRYFFLIFFPLLRFTLEWFDWTSFSPRIHQLLFFFLFPFKLAGVHVVFLGEFHRVWNRSRKIREVQAVIQTGDRRLNQKSKAELIKILLHRSRWWSVRRIPHGSEDQTVYIWFPGCDEVTG